MIGHYATVWRRHVKRRPLTSAIRVLGLAIGLACFILAYAAVVYVRNSDAHHPHAGRIVYVTSQTYLMGTSSVTPPSTLLPFVAADLLRVDFPELQKVARIRRDAVSVSTGAQTFAADIAFADRDLASIFRFDLVRGDEQALSVPRSAILTRGLALRLFGSADVVGRTLLVDDKVHIRVGAVISDLQQPSVFGASELSPVRAEAFVSMDVHRALIEASAPPGSPGASFDSWEGPLGYDVFALARSDSFPLAGLNDRLKKFAEDHVPGTLPGRVFELHPIATRLQQHLEGAWLSGPSSGFGVEADTVLLTLAGLILLVSCLNCASLAAAASLARARDIGLHKAIGARPAQIAVQQMLDSALTTLVAFVVAVAAVASAISSTEARWGLDLSGVLMRDAYFGVGVAAVLVCVAFACALYPTIALSRMKPVDALCGRFMAARSPRLLVTVQFAVASVLITFALLAHRQHTTLRDQALVAAADQLVVINNDLREANVDAEAFLDRLRAQPHIASVTSRHVAPWQGYAATALSLSPEASAHRVPVFSNVVSHDYLSTLGVPLLAGRDYDRSLSQDASPPWKTGQTVVRRVIVDRSTAELLGWTDVADAVGKRVYFPAGRAGGAASPIDIIGVAEDRLHSVRTIGPTSVIYILEPQRAVVPIVRIRPEHIAPALAEIDAVWKQFAPHTALQRRFMDEQFERSMRSFDALAIALGGLAAVAVLIAISGLVGMAAHVLARRAHEIGVRKALGASVADVTTMLLRDFSRPVIYATAVGWPLAWFLGAEYVRDFARRADPSVAPYAGSLLITIAVVCAAVIGQSMSAARAAPASILRHE